jgi:hypothetical protein
MDKSTLETYINQGFSTYQIAKITNKSQTSIRHWLKKFNLKTSHKSFKEACDNKNILLINERRFKTCPQCNQIKDLINDFYTAKNGNTHCWCKSCINKKTVEWQQKTKIQAINYKGGKCIKCGYDKCPAALDFHHLDPSKKDFSISSKKNRSFDKIKFELDKCVLICRNCHAELHFLQTKERAS